MNTKLLIFVLFIASNLFAQEDRPGYTDTPLIPGSKWRIHDKERPQPAKVAPGHGYLLGQPPSDAIILFDGTNLDSWSGVQEAKKREGINNGAFNILVTGQLTTIEEFADCQLHIEWMTPEVPEDRMSWGNSGVFLMGCIEVQILESHDSFIYADGNAGAIYGQYPPLVNPARRPGEWQSFDIIFTAPEIENGKQVKPAFLTVFYNGVLVQHHCEVLGKSAHRELPAPLDNEKGPVILQEHGSAVMFRNIWIRSLNNRTSPWSVEQANEWYRQWGWLRGCNFQPSTAINQLEMWQAETFDSVTIDRELGWAAAVGLNCMRVYLHHAAWEIDREGFKKRLASYLDIAGKHGISEWAWAVNPSQLLTAGVWNHDLSNLTKFSTENSDIITYHEYLDLTKHRQVVDTLKRYGRPMICTEYMARHFNSTFQEIMPMLKAENIGAINWGLVSGKTNTIFKWNEPLPEMDEPKLWFTDIFRKDGTPYIQEEVDVIKSLCQ